MSPTDEQIERYREMLREVGSDLMGQVGGLPRPAAVIFPTVDPATGGPIDPNIALVLILGHEEQAAHFARTVRIVAAASIASCAIISCVIAHADGSHIAWQSTVIPLDGAGVPITRCHPLVFDEEQEPAAISAMFMSQVNGEIAQAVFGHEDVPDMPTARRICAGLDEIRMSMPEELLN